MAKSNRGILRQGQQSGRTRCLKLRITTVFSLCSLQILFKSKPTMTILTTIAPPALLLLCLLAIPPLLTGPQQNGLMKLLQGDDAQISFFTLLIRFTLPILEPGHLSLSVQAIHFFAMWMSSWSLILLESFRPGPKDTSKRWVYAFGLAIECAGAGVVLPVWCLLNIVYSYRPFGPGGASTSLQSASIALPDLKALQWSLVIGAGVPTLILLVCPVQAPVASTSKETWIIVRLFHPITTGIVHWILQRVVFADSARDGANTNASESACILRRIHRVAFWMSALSHGLIMLAVGTVHISPSYFDEKLVNDLAMQSIWRASSPWQKGQSNLQTSETGIATFLFWDEVISALAVVLWAWTVNRVSLQEVKHRRTWPAIWKILVLILVAGPGAVAVSLIQEKDERLKQVQIQSRTGSGKA